MSQTEDQLEPLRAALSAATRPFVTFGDIPLEEPIKLLISGNATGVTFPPPSPESLTPLLEACHQASFGRGNQDVLDPTYRRALVLYGKDFGIAPTSAVDPYALGIVRDLQGTLFGEELEQFRRVVCKIDKLNVYREGDFFKGHVDTPRAPNMLGTLLINLPVEHAGGQLVIRPPGGGERVLTENDAGDLVQCFETKWGGTDALGWVAFFSDCSHEVLPVLSGNRVTLTYNLFLEDDEVEDNNKNEIDGAQFANGVVGQQLHKALTDPGLFTEEREHLCFHLQHRYPVDFNDTVARSVLPMLKGRDIILYRSLRRAGLAASFHFIMDTGYDDEPDRSALWILPTETTISSDTQSESGVGGLVISAHARNLYELDIVEVEPVPEDEEAAEDRLRWRQGENVSK